LTVLVGFVLSLGPFLQWDNHVSNIPLPYLLLSKILPGFKLVRVPSRFVFVALFGVAILAGLGFQELLHAVEQRSRSGFSAKAAAIAATLLWIMAWEFSQVLLPSFYLGPVLAGHREYAWLAAQPPGSAIVEVPTSDPLGHRSWPQLLW
jgi:asparagine N-glycosylation enzyme membrane subunit Stt3